MAVASLVVLGLGVLLVLCGLYLTFQERKRQRRVEGEKNLAEQISALAELVEALAKTKPGMQLMVLGILLIIIGGGMGSAAGIAAAAS